MCLLYVNRKWFEPIDLQVFNGAINASLFIKFEIVNSISKIFIVYIVFMLAFSTSVRVLHHKRIVSRLDMLSE